MPRDYILKPNAKGPVSQPGQSFGESHGTGIQQEAQATGPGLGKRTLPALSIKQPWAWLITSPEVNKKDFENRTWKTNFRGPVLIHAGKVPDWNWKPICQGVFVGLRILVPEDVTCGAIVGITTIIDCVHESNVNKDDTEFVWFQGPYGFKLKDSKPFSKPLPYKGALGFFTVPLEPVIIEQIREHKEYHGIV